MGLLLLRPCRWFGGNITPPIFYGEKITPHSGRNYFTLFFMGVLLLIRTVGLAPAPATSVRRNELRGRVVGGTSIIVYVLCMGTPNHCVHV